MIKFSNPRLTAEFDDWPIGGSERGLCKFTTEEKKGKFRVLKATAKNGVFRKPKASTYSGKLAIVDGEDGKTYIISFSQYNDDMIMLHTHDFMSPDPKVAPSSVFKDSNPEEYAALAELIKQANP